ncbi:MAG TPA: glycosyltransferase family 2 protein [Steroidobacteraceae bacterium]|nr:glycosyltransferase family 2 protein [Steroidobacteraceae bacterium]
MRTDTTNTNSTGAAVPKVSVIVPFYNEEESIEPLHAAVVAGLEPLNITFEMVFVDDGSKDSTAARARAIAERDPRVRFVRFRRNYGQTAAMAAGIDHAIGEILVTMDGDLQNDPADIAQFLQKIDSGYDIVVGWRFQRQDKLVSRKIPSRIANWLIGKVTGIPIRDNGCSLKAFRGSVIKRIPLYSDMHRFIPAMASIAGPRIAEVKVRHHARRFGNSKYGLSRIYKVLLDLLVIKTIASFAARPLMWFSLLALPLLLTGTSLLGYSLVRALLDGATPSLPLAGSGLILLASAFILFCSGAIGELIYDLGDSREHQYATLTQRLRTRAPNTEAQAR